jgi:hypothetical protein
MSWAAVEEVAVVARLPRCSSKCFASAGRSAPQLIDWI